MDMVRFEHIEYLYLLLLIALFIFIFVLRIKWSKKGIRKFGDINLVSKLIKGKPKYKRQIKFILLMLGFIFIILGLANLQFGSKIEKVKREGVDIVLAIDLSRSMKAEDIKPNRIERTKQFIYRLLDKLQNDRVALIVFAGKAYVQMPLTIDYSAARLFLSNIDTKIIPTQGTAIGEAIDLSLQLFEEGQKKYKTLIILSDGENHEGNAVEAAKSAAKEGVLIYTVGIGTTKGAPIPIYSGERQIDFQRDKKSNIVLSKINNIMLQEIASVGNGKYFRITNKDDNLKALLKEILKQDKKEIDTQMFTDYESKFQYFLGIGLFFLILELFIFERKSKWSIDFNNFKFTTDA